LEALDAAERLEARRLEEEGYDKHWLYVSDSPSNPYYSRYEKLMERAERTLRDKLASGAWLATGRDPRQPTDAPRTAIPSDRFAFLEFDFDKTALQGDDVRIIELLVSTAGAIRLSKSAKLARLGALDLQLSENPLTSS
jgi:hypothetical protein